MKAQIQQISKSFTLLIEFHYTDIAAHRNEPIVSVTMSMLL